MSTARRVNVMVTGPPAELGRIDPALQGELGLARIRCNFQGTPFHDRFRSMRRYYRITPGRKPDGFSIAAINLVMKEEIRLQPLGRERINAPGTVANLKPGHGRAAILVFHAPGDQPGGKTVKRQLHLAARAG